MAEEKIVHTHNEGQYPVDKKSDPEIGDLSRTYTDDLGKEQ